MNRDSMSDAPAHLHERIEAMRSKLLTHGEYRRVKRGKTLPPWVVSISGARCGLLLDEWLHGLHHLPRRQQPSDIDWSRGWVEVHDPSYGGLDTFDSDGLTRLVLLAHEHCIRAELSPAMNRFILRLHARSAVGTDHAFDFHPDLLALASKIEKRIDGYSKGGAR